MRTIIFTAVAALAAAGCTMDNPADTVVVTEPATDVVVAPTPTGTMPGVAGSLPFLGIWNCGSTSFTVTPGVYTTAGGAATRIETIERIGTDDFRLVLQDGKKIRLSGIADGQATWTNEATIDRSGPTETMSCTNA